MRAQSFKHLNHGESVKSKASSSRWRWPSCVTALVVSASVLHGSTVVYTDYAAWTAAVASGAISTLGFDDQSIAVGGFYTLNGNEYSYLPYTPTLSLIAGEGLTIWNPGAHPEVQAVSLDNVLYPQGSLGPSGTPMAIVRFAFAAPVNAVGAWFNDVEGGFGTTGFDLNLDGTVDVAFASGFPDGTLSFLGLLTDNATTAFDLYLGETPIDGVGIDDLAYGRVAVPDTGSVGSLTQVGILALFLVWAQGWGIPAARRRP